MEALALVAQVHAALLLAAAAAAGAVAALAPGLWLVFRRRPGPPWAARALLDWLIVAVVASVGLSAILGVLLFAGTGGPRDGLHVVYATVALVALPLARLMAAGPPADDVPPGRRSTADQTQATSPVPGSLTGQLVAWLVAGGVATLGALLRLSGTG